MKVSSGRLSEFSIAVPEPLLSSRGRFEVRAGLVLTLFDDGRHRGQGEASPLPGLSPDALGDVRAALEGFVHALPRSLSEDGEAAAAIAACVAEIPAGLPSARFALETALSDLWGRRRGISVAELVGGRASGFAVPLSALLGGSDLVRPARRALARGIRVLKRKVGARPFADDLEALWTLRRAVPEPFALRLDANGAWSAAEARRNLAALEGLGVALVEEPTRGPELLALGPTDPPWAADESLAIAGLAERLATAPGCAAFVLKPMLLGGAGACQAIAAIAREAGRGVIITHMLDGPLAAAACIELALSLPEPPWPSGLGPELDRRREARSPCLEPGRVAPAPRIGLGVQVP